MRRSFYKCALSNMIASLLVTLGFYIWMRVLKQKGSRDFRVMMFLNLCICGLMMDSNIHEILIKTKLPLNIPDLKRRKEMLELFVFDSNTTILINEQLKAISKNYFPEKIEHNYITLTSGQNVSFILNNGRLYISCDNYAQTFGYNAPKALFSKISQLNLSNVRERDLVFGLFDFYDVLIKRFIREYGIIQGKSFETTVIENLIAKKKLFQRRI